jgi:outer membrane protein OmpA-like peptidoglycan-associated protein
MNIKHISLFATSLAVLSLTLSVSGQAQNLVPNPSFEQVSEDAKEKDIKSFGLINVFSEEWGGATEVAPDLFMEREKESKVTIPCNDYGHQDPADGVFYAGFRAYSKSPKLKRSYLQVQLTEKLEENQMYCVSFDLSLADLSRYAVPDIGAILSDRKIERGGTAPIVQKPDVQHKSNKTMVYMDGWETVCGTFTGTGEEEYLVIGCFGGDASIEEEKVARSTAHRDCFTGKPQQPQAYYYVENVKVEAIAALSQCKCGAADERDMDLVYGSTSNLPEDASAQEVIRDAAIYYAFLKRMPTTPGKNTIATIAKLMKEDASLSLEVVGHCDDDEFNEGKINVRYKGVGKKRAGQVKRLLEAEGISADRIVVTSRENSDPASTRDSDIARAQNRRVTFSVN